MPHRFERCDRFAQLVLESLPLGCRFGQFHIATTEVLGEVCGLSHTTAIGITVSGLGFLPRRFNLREPLFQLAAGGPFLLDHRVQRFFAGTQLLHRLLGALFGARGDDLGVAELMLNGCFARWRRDLVGRWPIEIEDTGDGFWQLVEERPVPRHHLISNGPDRHQHVAGADQRDADDRDFDPNVAGMADQGFEAPRVGVDLDDQRIYIAIFVNPALGLTEASRPGDRRVRRHRAQGKTGQLRRLAFACDIEKLHAE